MLENIALGRKGGTRMQAGRITERQSRRNLLVASAAGFAGLSFGRPALSAPSPALPGGGKAKSVILFFLCGGASHLDTWDMKP